LTYRIGNVGILKIIFRLQGVLACSAIPNLGNTIGGSSQMFFQSDQKTSVKAGEAAVGASRDQPATAALKMASNGLTSNSARDRLEKDGPNATPDTSVHPLRNALIKFWAPVPWLLEASIVLQVVLHKYFEATIIAALLIFNVALAYLQEGRAQATLAALKSRLALKLRSDAMDYGRPYRQLS
jgi:magnesium-transporting ATPase (P-type)